MHNPDTEQTVLNWTKCSSNECLFTVAIEIVRAIPSAYLVYAVAKYSSIILSLANIASKI